MESFDMSTKEECTMHSLVGDNLDPYCKGSGRRAVMMALGSYSGLLLWAKKLPEVKITSQSERRGSKVGCNGSTGGNH